MFVNCSSINSIPLPNFDSKQALFKIIPNLATFFWWSKRGNVTQRKINWTAVETMARGR